VDNLMLRLPERARNPTPRGIGQLPERTLRNTNHISDDKPLTNEVLALAVAAARLGS
jgi:hypothetical protein